MMHFRLDFIQWIETIYYAVRKVYTFLSVYRNVFKYWEFDIIECKSTNFIKDYP